MDMDSFNDLYGSSAPKKMGLLRTDWGAEESRYARGLVPFRDALAAAIPIAEFPYGFAEVSDPQGKATVASVAQIPVPPIVSPCVVSPCVPCVGGSEKIEKKVAGIVPVPVEYKVACPQGGSGKAEPIEPEKKMPKGERPIETDTEDPFEIFSQPSPAPLQPSDNKDVVGVAPPENTLGDPFFSSLSAEVRAAKPVAATPSPTAPEPKPETKKEQPKAEQPKVDQPKTGSSQSNADGQAFEDFDYHQFERVRKVAERILSGVPSVDLPRILASIPQYSVRMEFDHYRESPEIVTEKLIRVEALRESLYALTVQLTPLYYSMKSAADYISQAALVCSSASSREKRLAQIKLVDSEFWVRHSEVCRTYESVQQAFEFLQRQYETVSRMITLLQIRLRVSEISRGELPFGDGDGSHIDRSKRYASPINAPTIQTPEAPPPFDGPYTPAPNPNITTIPTTKIIPTTRIVPLVPLPSPFMDDPRMVDPLPSDMSTATSAAAIPARVQKADLGAEPFAIPVHSPKVPGGETEW